MALSTPFCDTVHKWTYSHPPTEKLFGRENHAKQALVTRMDLRQARRFSIDDKMVELAVEASAHQNRFPLWIALARLPYDKIWLEWDQTTKILKSEAMGYTHASPPGFADEERPHGLLLSREGSRPDRWTATEFTGDGPLAVGYGLWTDADETSPAVPAGQSVDRVLPEYGGHAGFIQMGYGAPGGQFLVLPWFKHRVTATVTPLYRDSFASMYAKHKGRRAPGGDEALVSEYKRLIEAAAMRTRGVMRFIIAILAMMNEVPTVTEEVPARRGSSTAKGRAVPFLSYETLAIDLPKRRGLPAVARILSAAYARRRAHEVRGHWRRLTREYLEGSEMVTPTGKAIVRSADGTARIWIDDHVRGDASIGWVAKDYGVKAETDPEKTDTVSDRGQEPR